MASYAAKQGKWYCFGIRPEQVESFLEAFVKKNRRKHILYLANHGKTISEIRRKA